MTNKQRLEAAARIQKAHEALTLVGFMCTECGSEGDISHKDWFTYLCETCQSDNIILDDSVSVDVIKGLVLCRKELLTLLADAERDVDNLESAHKTADENRSYWQTKCIDVERENDELREKIRVVQEWANDVDPNRTGVSRWVTAILNKQESEL